MNGHLFMDAVITPHRSLSSRGFIVLIGTLTLINTVSAIFFFSIGAGPVPIFLGLDVAAVVLAFRASRRAAFNLERVQVTAEEVRVLFETPKGVRTVWISPTAFTRVAMVGPPGREDDLQIRLSDRYFRIGQSLTRTERLAFAKALDRAIWRAKTGRAPVASLS